MLSRKGEPSSELTTFLSHGFMDWVRNHFAVPIDWGGDTAEFQFWYQQARIRLHQNNGEPGVVRSREQLRDAGKVQCWIKYVG